MWRLALDMRAEVTEDQRLLNGTRYRCVEGSTEIDGAIWTLLLNYGCPKELPTAIEEADLSLATADGEMVAGLESGRADIVVDDVTGIDREVLELAFRIEGGDGPYERLQGTVHVKGELEGEGGRILTTLECDQAPGAPVQ